MKFSIDGQVVLLRAPEGPLAAYIKRFVASLSVRGETRSLRHTARPIRSSGGALASGCNQDRYDSKYRLRSHGDPPPPHTRRHT